MYKFIELLKGETTNMPNMPKCAQNGSSDFRFTAFSLAEMMVVMLIMSIVLAAMAPMVTTRIKADEALKASGIASGGSSDNNGPWKWVENSDSDAYSEASRNMIGQTEAEEDDGDAMLIINKGADDKDAILFKFKNLKKNITRFARLDMWNLYSDYKGLLLGDATLDPDYKEWGGISIGFGNSRSGVSYSSVMLGYENTLKGRCSIAVGEKNDIIRGDYVSILGSSNTIKSSGYTNIVGRKNTVNDGFIYIFGENNVADDSDVDCYDGNGHVVGDSNELKAPDSTVVGNKNTTTRAVSYASSGRCFAFGDGNSVKAKDFSMAIGDKNTTAYDGIALGCENNVISLDSIAIGYNNKLDAFGSMAIGSYNVTSGSGSMAIGKSSNASGAYSLAIGITSPTSKAPKAAAESSIAIGPATANGIDSIAVGKSAEASALYSFAFGSYCVAAEKYAVAVGYDCSSAAENASSFGINSKASGTGSIAIGYKANATGNYSVAIGSSQLSGTFKPPKANADWSVAIGYGAVADRPYEIVLGGEYTTEVKIPGYLQAWTLRVGNGSSGNGVLLVNGGVVTVDGTLKVNGTTVQSDKRLKYIKGENKNGLDAIKKIKIYNFTFKKDKDKEPRVGVIAQELQKILPDAVKKGSDGFLTIRIDDIIYTLVNAVKELDKKVSELTQTLKQVQAEQKRINQRLDTLEQKSVH